MTDSDEQRPDEELDDPQIPADISEEELRAAYEEELKRIRVDDVLVQTVVSLLNLAARRAGLTGVGEEEIDWDQVGQAIEGTRALLPLVEPVLGPEVKQVRDALSQLQMAYARSGAAPPEESGGGDPGEAEPPPAKPRAADPSSRLWVPGR
jgi:hypothetical protein